MAKITKADLPLIRTKINEARHLIEVSRSKRMQKKTKHLQRIEIEETKPISRKEKIKLIAEGDQQKENELSQLTDEELNNYILKMMSNELEEMKAQQKI